MYREVTEIENTINLLERGTDKFLYTIDYSVTLVEGLFSQTFKNIVYSAPFDYFDNLINYISLNMKDQ